MASREKKDLRVETEHELVRKSGQSPRPGAESESPPSLAQLHNSSSSSSVSEVDLPFLTPRKQKVMTKEDREEKAKAFVREIGLNWSDLSSDQRIRARKIQSPDFTWSPTKGDAPENERYTTTFKYEWERFVGGLPEMHRRALSTFEHVFFDEAAITDYMAIRLQLSGICSAHASVLGQHYIESCRRSPQKEDHTMLDISSFIRNQLPPDIQKRYILEGVTGLNSFQLLQRFTDTEEHDFPMVKPCRKSVSEKKHRRGIETLFNDYTECKEPGLVGSFKVGAEFADNAILEGTLDEQKYQQIVNEREKANVHAMILLGAYRSDDGRYWFVLQNTHKHRYFKLVDGEYLASCDATVYFAGKDIDMSLKGEPGVVIGEYFETAFDVEECMPYLPAEG